MLVIHASDLHLGRPLRALPVRSGLDVDAFRHCAIRTLARLADLALNEHAALILVAGDLVEESVRDYKVGLRLIHELSRLESSGTRVVWVRGNHDAENRVISNLLLPSHVHEIGLSGAQTLRFEDLGVSVIGASYGSRACFDDLLAHYPSREDGLCTIGLLHTSADGAITGDHYAPCRRSDLVAKEYDYFALGHVHQPVAFPSSIPIAYSGCLQGRSFFESGARGCMMVRLEDARSPELAHRSLETVRFGAVHVDIANAQNLNEVLEALAKGAQTASTNHPGRALVVRFHITGRGGTEVLLSTAASTRQRALSALVSQMPEKLAIDGVWLDPGHTELPVINLAGNEVERLDVY